MGETEINHKDIPYLWKLKIWDHRWTLGWLANWSD